MSRLKTPPQGAREIGVAISSQRALASNVGVSQQMISDAERGLKRPTPPVLKRIAREVHVSVDALLGALASIVGVAEAPEAFVDERQQWTRAFDRLSPEARVQALAFFRGLG